jgi:hypothetical protein
LQWTKDEAGKDLANFLRKLFFWNYARNTWQWDLLCVLILVFIFLTPKTWFTNGERQLASVHQKPISTLLVEPEVVENVKDRSEIERHVRTLSGRPDAVVVDVRKSFDQKGKARGYEVDIR